MSITAMKQALEDYMSAFGQALEAHGIQWQEQQIEADKKARQAIVEAEQEPKREWVGLTEEEIDLMWKEWKDALCLDHKTWSRAIEAKLKEKNT